MHKAGIWNPKDRGDDGGRSEKVVTPVTEYYLT